jgi:hypothetical protein
MKVLCTECKQEFATKIDFNEHACPQWKPPRVGERTSQYIARLRDAMDDVMVCLEAERECPACGVPNPDRQMDLYSCCSVRDTQEICISCVEKFYEQTDCGSADGELNETQWYCLQGWIHAQKKETA